MSDNRLGLTDDEIELLRINSDMDWAKNLINLYNLVVAQPQDPGARGLFAAALREWRFQTLQKSGAGE